MSIQSIALLGLLMMGCISPSSKKDKIVKKSTAERWVGFFVDDAYIKRAEGYDWVGVVTSLVNDSTVHVSVRSRADQKKATCTFDVNATILDDSTLTAQVNGATIYFIVRTSDLIIRAPSEADEMMLGYFCSGGASIAGKYQRQAQPLDEQQVDKTIFLKNLSLQNVFFEVRSIRTDSSPLLTVTTVGLKHQTAPYITPLTDQEVMDAEIEDLNADGSPELLIYTSTQQRDKPVQVIGFSVNKMKSMSMIAMPDLQDNAEVFKEYRGYDECRILENRLMRRFPLAGKSKEGYPIYRFITYKMVEGEAMRRFEIESIR